MKRDFVHVNIDPPPSVRNRSCRRIASSFEKSRIQIDLKKRKPEKTFINLQKAVENVGKSRESFRIPDKALEMLRNKSIFENIFLLIIYLIFHNPLNMHNYISKWDNWSNKRKDKKKVASVYWLIYWFFYYITHASLLSRSVEDINMKMFINKY